MSRIENAVFEQEVASSLLSPAEQEQESAQPEQAESEYAAPGDELLNEAIADQADDRFRDGDEGAERLRSERPEVERHAQPEERLRSERAPQENEQAQRAAEPTPEQVQEGIQKLDAAVEQFGLNEPADAREFASDFCSAFGTDIYKAGVDVEQLGGVMAKTAVSALQVYDATGGDLSKMGAIPEQSAQAFAHDLLKGMGIDPRSMNVDASLLARTTLGGMMNFLNTYASYGGKVTDLAKLNDPQAAEFYLQNFLKALGQGGPVSRETALKFADACARQLLRVMGKVSQVNASQERQPRGRSRGQRVPTQLREGIRGSRAPRFKTNEDIFDPGVVAAATTQRL